MSRGRFSKETEEERIDRELKRKYHDEFWENNPNLRDISGTARFPKKLQLEIESGQTHHRDEETLIETYYPWKLESDPEKSKAMMKNEDLLAQATPEEIKAAEKEKSTFLSKSYAESAASDAILPLLLEQVAANMDWGYSPHIPSLTNPNASRLLDLIGDSPVQKGLPGGEITTPKTERPFNPELMYQEGGPVPDKLGYKHFPSVEEEVSDAGYEDILDYIMREAPGILKSGAKTGVNTLADYLTKPAGFKSSHQLISEGQESTPGETAYSNTELDDEESQFSYFLKGLMDNEDTWFPLEPSAYKESQQKYQLFPGNFFQQDRLRREDKIEELNKIQEIYGKH